jgi:general secretion pathway protein D
VYRNLRAVIDQLDVRRAQVYIESLIVEVTSDKTSEFGVQWVGATGNSNSSTRVGVLQSFTTGGTSNSLTGIYSGAGSVLPSNGLSFGLFNSSGLGFLAHSLESDSNANILSTPNLITLDNELATIKVGQNVPILTGSYTTSSSTSSNPFQTIERKDVGLTLKVRPQISEGGTIRLAIYHETSSVDSSTLTDANGITINSRVIENNIVADDGQIIVLGGLMSDTGGDGTDKVHGLGDLPIIGNLFKYQSRTRAKTNLMVFLRPVIVRSKEQSASLSTDRYDYMRSQQSNVVTPQTGLVNDLGQPMLPELQNGKPISGGVLAQPPAQIPAPLRNPGAAENVPAQPVQQ